MPVFFYRPFRKTSNKKGQQTHPLLLPSFLYLISKLLYSNFNAPPRQYSSSLKKLIYIGYQHIIN